VKLSTGPAKLLNEQMEEEKTVRDRLDRLGLAGSDPASLLMLDREAGALKASGPAGEGGAQ
jgi:ferritin